MAQTIHTVISESEGAYVAECREIAVTTQGESLDETLRNLREAVGLFMDGEDPAALGLKKIRRLCRQIPRSCATSDQSPTSIGSIPASRIRSSNTSHAA